MVLISIFKTMEAEVCVCSSEKAARIAALAFYVSLIVYCILMLGPCIQSKHILQVFSMHHLVPTRDFTMSGRMIGRGTFSIVC